MNENNEVWIVKGKSLFHEGREMIKSTWIRSNALEQIMEPRWVVIGLVNLLTFFLSNMQNFTI